MNLPETDEREKLLRDKIADYLAEVYQDKHADTVAYEITEIIEKWLKQAKQAQESKILIHSNKVNRLLMIDDLIAELAI